MESFKSKLQRVLIESNAPGTTRMEKLVVKLFSLFQAVGALFTLGFIISIVWNFLGSFLLLEPVGVYETIRDFAACVGLILSYELVQETKKNLN